MHKHGSESSKHLTCFGERQREDSYMDPDDSWLCDGLMECKHQDLCKRGANLLVLETCMSQIYLCEHV